MLKAASQYFVTDCQSIELENKPQRLNILKPSNLHTSYNVLVSVQLNETWHAVLYWTSKNGVTVYGI